MSLLARTRAALARKADYRQVFGTAAGRRVLADLFREAGMNAQIHVPGDPFATAHNTGKHRIGQRIQGMLGESDEAVIRRMEEGEPYGSPTEDTSHL